MGTREPSSITIAIVIGSALAAIALDQSVKAAIAGRLAIGRLYGWPTMGVRRLAGRRLGAVPLPDRAVAALWAGTLACTVAAVAVGRPVVGTALGLGLSLGGAAGNLIDRVARGAVVDFIVVWRWPTFNLADTALVAGVGLVVVSVL